MSHISHLDISFVTPNLSFAVVAYFNSDMDRILTNRTLNLATCYMVANLPSGVGGQALQRAVIHNRVQTNKDFIIIFV